MRTFIILALGALFMVTSCKSGPKSETSEATKATETEMTEKKAEPTGKLAKWPDDYPVDGDSVAVISTKFGDIVLEFYPDVAPNHVRNFKYLANHGFYNGCAFHRVIPGFMIQGGDPNSKDANKANDGTGGPGWSVGAEFSPKEHIKGTLSMARSRDPNSAGSQFFVCVARAKSLDNQYTVFGQTIKGVEVADKIVSQPRDQRDNPNKRIEMTIKIVSRSEAGL